MTTIQTSTRTSQRLGRRLQRSIALRVADETPRRTPTERERDERLTSRADERVAGRIHGRVEEDERPDRGVSNLASGDEEFRTYTDEEYGYRVAYPTKWSVEPEPAGGASFDALAPSGAGAVVFVDDGIESVSAYAEAFVADLRADDHVHATESVRRREVRLNSGHRGQRIECAYIGDAPTETARFVYLLAVVDGVGYTLGVDWNDDDTLGGVATRIIESFTITTGSGDDRSETGRSS